MDINKIYNEDCFITMERMPIGTCTNIITSPPYNTNKKLAGGNNTIDKEYHENGAYKTARYDTPMDGMSNDEYNEFTINLFDEFDRLLLPDGSVEYNLSYGNENNEGMFKAINSIITYTPFTIADVIIWKKKSAMPNSVSSNKLTRITEFVFVFCRKLEYNSFFMNKNVTSIRKTGQKAYENIYNFIESPNNDGECPYNHATYSSSLVRKLINLYAPTDALIYDPFMGSGTTAIACIKEKRDYIGSEISSNQCKFALNRINTEIMYPNMF